jgi:hypothetical protein
MATIACAHDDFVPTIWTGIDIRPAEVAASTNEARLVLAAKAGILQSMGRSAALSQLALQVLVVHFQALLAPGRRVDFDYGAEQGARYVDFTEAPEDGYDIAW